MTDAWFEKQGQLNSMLAAKYGESLADMRGMPKEAFPKAADQVPQKEKAQLRGHMQGGKSDLPGGVGVGGMRPAAPMENLVMEEETIMGYGRVKIDCGGTGFFAEGSSAELFLVDLSAEFHNCRFGNLTVDATNFSTDGFSPPRAVATQNSLVRFFDCAFDGPTAGLSVDTSFIDVRRATFLGLEDNILGGAAVLIGDSTWRVGGAMRFAGDRQTIHRMNPQVYVVSSTFEANSGLLGAGVRMTRGTWYCHHCSFLHNSAIQGGGAVALGRQAAAILTKSTFLRNTAKRGAAVYAASGTATVVSTTFKENAARLHGGAVYLDGVAFPSPLSSDRDAQVHTAVMSASVSFLYAILDGNVASGSTSEPGMGGALFITNGAAANFERSSFHANRAGGTDGEGGCFMLLNHGSLIARDSLVNGSQAAYGAVLRVDSFQIGTVTALLDNMTLTGNNASRFGAVLALHAHAHAVLRPFTFSAGRFYYSVDPQGFRQTPLLRFGFNADPYLYPYYATVAPHGTNVPRSNPSEPLHFTRELPPDPRLTDQWPFFATGERHEGYFDARTTSGQKSASGGVAFLLQARGGGREWSTADENDFTGVVAFKDCNVFGNTPAEHGACAFHQDIMQKQCVHETKLL